MKPEHDVVKSLERLRLAEPGGEFKDRVLSAARREWSAHAAGEKAIAWWQPLARPAFALAASLVIAVAGGWVNDAIVRQPGAALAPAAPELQELQVAGDLGRWLRAAPASAESAAAALEQRRAQINDLLGQHPEGPASAAPEGGVQGFRQRASAKASYC